MPNVVIRAKGLGGHVELRTDRIRITRTGLRAFLRHGFRGNRELPLADVSSIEFKEVGTTNGYIKFVCAGGGRGREVALEFTAAQAEQFNRLMKHIETLTERVSGDPERLGPAHTRGGDSDEDPAGAHPPRMPFSVATTRELPSTNGKHAAGWLHHMPANLSHRATMIGIGLGVVYVVSMVVLSDRDGSPPAAQLPAVEFSGAHNGREDRMGFADDLQRRMDSMATGFRATVSGPDGTTLHYEIPAASHFAVDEWVAGVGQQSGLLQVATLKQLGFEQFIVSDSTGELGRWTVAQFASYDGS